MRMLFLLIPVTVFACPTAAAGALRLIAPAGGARVETLRAAQRDYLALPRAERHKAMETASARKGFLAVGSTQEPLVLRWTGAAAGQPVELEIFPEGGSAESFALAPGASEVRITNLETGRRYRWSVTSAGAFASGWFDTSDRGPRALRAGGVWNFRDLGGWKAADARRVRQNLIFRSAGLRFSSKNVGASIINARYELGARRVTDAGIETLRRDFKIRTDLELRSDRECAGMVDSVLGPDVRWVRVPFAAYDFIDALERGKEAFSKAFAVFADERNYPILMHCSGGRDRTGTLAFLLNGLLGVAEEDLRRDWEFSIFSDAGASFMPSRLERLAAYLAKLPGRTLTERIETYVRGCGVAPEEIATFRRIMLEEAVPVSR